MRWSPALVDDAELDRLAAAMPGPIVASRAGDRAQAATLEVLGAVVDAIVTEAAGSSSCRRRRPRPAHAAAVARGFRHPARRLPVRGPRRRRRRGRRSGSTGGSTRSAASHPDRARGASSIHPTAATRGSCPCSAAAPRAACCRSSWRSADSKAHQAAGRRAGPSGTPPPRTARGPVRLRRGPGVPEPGRGLGADDRHRPRARGRRVRGARPGAVAAQADARRCGCSPSPPATPSSAPTS